MTDYDSLATSLATVGVGGIRRGEPLSRHCSWRIGGPADIMVEPANLRQLAACCRLLADCRVPSVVIGQGTNLLFDDRGLQGVVIKIAKKMAGWRADDNQLSVQPGLWAPYLGRIASRLGLAGLEHIAGIPGTLGGITAMNGGSLRRSISENIVAVRAVERTSGTVVDLDRSQCAFSYRGSRFQHGDLIVGEIQLRCKRDDPLAIRRRTLDILRERTRKFPRKQPNCGSVFASNREVYGQYGPPGKAIEMAGLKGCRIGAAEVSRKHANFIVNLGGASARDVLRLIAWIRARVYRHTSIWMETEVRCVSCDGLIVPASEAMERI